MKKEFLLIAQFLAGATVIYALQFLAGLSFILFAILVFLYAFAFPHIGKTLGRREVDLAYYSLAFIGACFFYLSEFTPVEQIDAINQLAVSKHRLDLINELYRSPNHWKLSQEPIRTNVISGILERFRLAADTNILETGDCPTIETQNSKHCQEARRLRVLASQFIAEGELTRPTQYSPRDIQLILGSGYIELYQVDDQNHLENISFPIQELYFQYFPTGFAFIDAEFKSNLEASFGFLIENETTAVDVHFRNLELTTNFGEVNKTLLYIISLWPNLLVIALAMKISREAIGFPGARSIQSASNYVRGKWRRLSNKFWLRQRN